MPQPRQPAAGQAHYRLRIGRGTRTPPGGLTGGCGRSRPTGVVETAVSRAVGGRRLPVAPAGRRRQAATALQTAGLDDLDAARRRHPGAEAVDLDPLALLRLVGAFHADLNVFRRLTIPCAALRFVRSFGLRP